MARKVFFSFHYKRDLTRANIVRNTWLAKGDREPAGFFDARLWEEANKKGQSAIEKMIDDALKDTTVRLLGRGSRKSRRQVTINRSGAV